VAKLPDYSQVLLSRFRDRFARELERAQYDCVDAGINPFTRVPMLFKAKPDTARVLFEERPIGQIYWAMDDSCRLIVSADAGFEDKVAKVAQDVASRLGWRFVAGSPG
jgi:hypothetical protein